MLNITSQWRDHEFFFFCYKSALQKICRMLKTLVPRVHRNLSTRLKDIAEKKQAPVKLKPIVERLTARSGSLFVTPPPPLTRAGMCRRWLV